MLTPACAQVGDSLEEFLVSATDDAKLRQLMMSMSEAIRTIAFKVGLDAAEWRAAAAEVTRLRLPARCHAVCHCRANRRMINSWFRTAHRCHALAQALRSPGQVRTASCSAMSCVNSFGDEQLAVDLLADKLLFEALKFSVSCAVCCRS